MTKIEKVLYTGKTHTTGGRDGLSRSSDGHLDIKLSPPGSKGAGTNPEQLFAAGWSACFIGAMGIAASKRKVALPADLAVDAEVDLGTTDGAYFLQARLNVSLPGLAPELARELVDEAHRTCPYSNATSGCLRNKESRYSPSLAYGAKRRMWGKPSRCSPWSRVRIPAENRAAAAPSTAPFPPPATS